MPRQQPRPKTTFVGPITKRASSYTFLIQQGGMAPIQLEYPTLSVSRQSRAQLLETHHTYPVPSTKMLMAIHQALLEKHGTPLKQTENEWDETNVPSMSPDETEDSTQKYVRASPIEPLPSECRVNSKPRQLSPERNSIEHQ